MNKFFKTIFLGLTLCLICSCHKVEALTQNGVTVYTSNYGVVAQCTNCNSVSGADFPFEKIRYTINSPGLTGGVSYHYVLNASTSIFNTNLPIIPNACYMYVNNQYLVVQNESITRTSYECGQLYCQSNWTYEFDRLIQTSQVPDVFVECDFPNNLNLKFRSTFFNSNFNITGDSTISAINNNSQAIQNANQSNTNSINSHIDSLKNQNTTNSNSIISKIQDVLSGLTSGFSNVISAISNGVSTLSQNFGNALGNVGSAITTILTTISNRVTGVANAVVSTGANIITAIGDGISNLVGTQEVCTTFYETHGNEVIVGQPLESGFLDSTGSISTLSGWGTSPFLSFKENVDYKISNNNISSTANKICFYRSDKTFIECQNLTNNTTTTIRKSGSRFAFIRYSTTISTGSISSFVGDCKKTGISSIFNRLGDFFNNLFSSILNPTDTIGKLQDITQSSETPISDLLLMPVSLINTLHDSLSPNQTRNTKAGVHDCRTYTIPFDFTGGNNTLTFPCIKLEDYLGSNIWSAIDLILSGCMIYAIGMMIISFFESWTSLQDTFDTLYTGQHIDSGYTGKHNGGNRGFFDL